MKFENGDTSPTIEVSHVVEAALNQILEQIMKEKNMSQSMAETYLYSGGLKIYTTQDTAIQATLEEVIKQDKYYTHIKTKKKDGTTLEQNSIPTMAIMDHKTGNVVAASSAVGEKGERVTSTKIGYFNIPTKLRKSTGSSMKPISVIAPGLESGIITAATVYNDAQTKFDGGKYTPKNYYPGYKGLMNIRTAIEISANIPHVKALADIGVDKSVDFCESVGLPLSGDEGLSLALGGLGKGVTVTEMAGAYSVIANDGTYIEPTFYKYVTDKNDNVVIEPKQEINKVMSEQNAYIEKNILQEPVVGANGTAKYCAIKGMDVAAKTGTTNGDLDRWLCGFSPYYTAACWYGYETNATVKYGNGNPAGRIWAEVMARIHKDLPNAEFVRPEGIVEVQVCKSTGLKATSNCGETYTELFTKGNEPEECDSKGSGMLMICTQTNLLCAEGCPYGEYRNFGGVPPHEKDAPWEPSYTEASTAPTEHCPHGVDQEWLAKQKQAEAEAQALQAQIDADNAAAAAATVQQQTPNPTPTPDPAPSADPTPAPEPTTTPPTQTGDATE